MDRRVDERFRKPRRTKGTPFYAQRNYWAAGAIAVAGLTWFLMELTPGAKKVKLWLREHSESQLILDRKHHVRASFEEPALNSLLVKLRQRQV